MHGQQAISRGRQQRPFVLAHRGIGDPSVCDAVGQPGVVEQAMIDEICQVDEPRIAGEGGTAEIRRVVLPVHRERKDLPQGGSRGGQPLHEPARLVPERADVVSTRERRGMEQHSERARREWSDTGHAQIVPLERGRTSIPSVGEHAHRSGRARAPGAGLVSADDERCVRRGPPSARRSRVCGSMPLRTRRFRRTRAARLLHTRDHLQGHRRIGAS